MSKRLTSILRIFAVQLFLTFVFGLTVQYAYSAPVEVIKLKQHINTYLYEGESIDVLKELNLKPTDLNNRLKAVKIKAQGIETNAKIKFVVNGKSAKSRLLDDKMKQVYLKLNANEAINKLELHSKGAFVRLAIVDLVSDEPIDDDTSRRFPISEPPPEPVERGFSLMNLF